MSPVKGHQALLGYIKKDSEEVQILKKRLSEYEKKEIYLRSLVLQHQINIAKSSSFARIWELSSGKTGLDEKVLDNMQSVISQCEVVSAHQVTSANMEIIVEPEDRDENQHVDDPVETKKKWNIEGKVWDIAYVITIITASSISNPVESTGIIESIALSSSNNQLERFKDTVKNVDHDMQMFTLGLYTYQFLGQELKDAMSELEEFMNMEVRQTSDHVQFFFVPNKDHEFSVIWKVAWDSRNLRFKNDIWVECNDDVVARFSQRKDAYPYLKGEKLLSNKKQVLQFFGEFVDDLLEESLNK